MTDLGTIVDAHTVRFERLLPGAIERVWDYLTKPEPFLPVWRRLMPQYERQVAALQKG